MEGPSQKRLKNELDDDNEDTNLDYLCSNLPDDVISHILSFLSIRYTISTTSLSRRYQHTWKTCQVLTFDYMFTRTHSQAQVGEVIHNILTQHYSNQIKTFHICVNPYGLEPLIPTWLSQTLRKNPSKVDLDFYDGRYNVEAYDIPFELIDIESINYLRLSYCSLNLPKKFSSLKFLHTLLLRRIRLDPSYIAIFIDNCINLKCLDIVKCTNCPYMNIDATKLRCFSDLRIGDCVLDVLVVDAPKLQSFHFVGKPKSITFKSTMPQLKDVFVKFHPTNIVPPRSHMHLFMSSFSHVDVLTFNAMVLEDLCSTFIHVRRHQGPPLYLWHTKEIQLFMDTPCFCNPYDIISFIDKFPYVERLFIDFQKFTFAEMNLYWEVVDKDRFDKYDKQCSFLKLVKFSNFKFRALELKLVKFLLEKSPNLGYIAIFTEKKFKMKKGIHFINNILRDMNNWKSSHTARVAIYEYYDMEDDRIIPKHYDVWFSPFE